MLRASILSSSVFHNLGDSNTFCKTYSEMQETDFSTLSDLDISSLSEVLPKTNLRRVPRYARIGLLTAARCLQNIQKEGFPLPISSENPQNHPLTAQNTALVIGTAFSSSQMNIDFMDSILDNSPELSSPTAFSHAVNNMGAGLISLILNIQGGCQTITQFDQSFAGAIQTALLLLESGKNDYVLVGAVDELDKRFTYTCKDELQSTPYPLTEGAVFFLLAKEQENTAKISVRWENSEKTKELLAENKSQVFLSGYGEDCKELILNNKDIINNAAFYGTSPLAQALDTFIVLNSEKNNSQDNICICKQKNSKTLSLLQVEKI